jgi:hypothetical protein
LLLLLAYPPAHTTDSNLFFLYAERLAGYDIPLIDQVVYPLYPFLITISYHWLGSVYYLIAVQFLMSISIAPLYYLALKPYSPTLALFISILLLADIQSAVWYNFTGTEPLYMFLLTVALAILLRQMNPVGHRKQYFADATVGVLLVLMWLTRTVGRYLLIPYAILIWLNTRDWKHTLAMVSGFLLSLVLFSLLSTLALGRVAGLTATDYTFVRMVIHHPEWIAAENGPATQTWLEATERCQPVGHFHYAYCLYQQEGEWGKVEAITTATFLETIRANPGAYIIDTWNNLATFLATSGDMFNRWEEPPGQVQCSTIEDRASLIDAEFTQTNISRLTLPLLEYQGKDFAGELTRFRDIMREIMGSLCPSTPHLPALRDVADWMMVLNRAFSPPGTHLWLGLLLILATGIPWARRYLPLILAFGVTLLMLSLPPAMLSAQFDRRLVLPIVIPRIVLMGTLLYLVLRIAIYALDWLLSRRGESKRPEN